MLLNLDLKTQIAYKIDFQLCDQARADPEFAALLARGPIEAIDTRGDKKRSISESDNPIEDIVATKYSNGQIGRILKRDFIVRKTGKDILRLVAILLNIKSRSSLNSKNELCETRL